MNRLVALILIICLGSQSLARFGIIAWYEINKEYVAKNLCENRDKPQMKCCGKCYLKKKLDKVDDNIPQGKHQPNKVEKSEVTDCIIPSLVSLHPVFYNTTHTYNASRLVFYHHLHTSAVFHPPAIVC